ncbi:DUF6097 family protein [Bordetella tumulicola]|uniref:DUF6097 family protein n=1 Tax=Bordetella tumulicola TaxID=1649133 RepID=UPI0039EE0763
MSSSHNVGASLSFSQFAKLQLLGMHSLIDAQQIPVEKTDDFWQQATDLERALGDQTYAQSLRRYNAAKKMVIVACVILVIALIIYALFKFGIASDTILDAANRLTAGVMPFSTAIDIIAGLLLAALIGAHFYVRSLGKNLAGKNLSTLWTKILQRWAPDLAAKHPVAGRTPDVIAQLVATQIKIQDIDLDLNVSA